MKELNTVLVDQDAAKAQADQLAESETFRQVARAQLAQLLATKVIPFHKANQKVENDMAWRERLIRLEAQQTKNKTAGNFDAKLEIEINRIKAEEISAEPVQMTPKEGEGMIAWMSTGATSEDLAKARGDRDEADDRS